MGILPTQEISAITELQGLFARLRAKQNVSAQTANVTLAKSLQIFSAGRNQMCMTFRLMETNKRIEHPSALPEDEQTAAGSSTEGSQTYSYTLAHCPGIRMCAF